MSLVVAAAVQRSSSPSAHYYHYLLLPLAVQLAAVASHRCPILLHRHMRQAGQLHLHVLRRNLQLLVAVVLHLQVVEAVGLQTVVVGIHNLQVVHHRVVVEVERHMIPWALEVPSLVGVGADQNLP